MQVFRRCVGAIAAAGAAGIAVGVVARILMRLVRLSRGTAPEFSWTGSVGIVAAFVIVMIPGALLSALWGGRARSVLLWVGGLLLLGPALGIGNDEAALGEPMALWRRLGVILLGVAVLGVVMSLPVVTRLLVDRWTRGVPGGRGAVRPG